MILRRLRTNDNKLNTIERLDDNSLIEILNALSTNTNVSTLVASEDFSSADLRIILMAMQAHPSIMHLDLRHVQPQQLSKHVLCQEIAQYLPQFNRYLTIVLPSGYAQEESEQLNLARAWLQNQAVAFFEDVQGVPDAEAVPIDLNGALQ